jgi:hypothetical protein
MVIYRWSDVARTVNTKLESPDGDIVTGFCPWVRATLENARFGSVAYRLLLDGYGSSVRMLPAGKSMLTLQQTGSPLALAGLAVLVGNTIRATLLTDARIDPALT